MSGGHSSSLPAKRPHVFEDELFFVIMGVAIVAFLFKFAF